MWPGAVGQARAARARAVNDLHWRHPRYRWAATEAWLGEPLTPATPEQGWAELVRGTFAPSDRQPRTMSSGGLDRPRPRCAVP